MREMNVPHFGKFFQNNCISKKKNVIRKRNFKLEPRLTCEKSLPSLLYPLRFIISFIHYLYSLTKMNLNIDRALPSPPSVPSTFTLTYAASINSVFLYGHSKSVEEKTQEPKKKIAFKIDKMAVAAAQQILLYSISERKWLTQEAKGKLPSRRSNMKTIFMDPCLIVYGGKSLSEPVKLFNDVYALNINTWNWKKLFSLQAPPVHENPIVIKMRETQLAVFSQTLWVLNLGDINWELNAPQLPGAVWQRLDLGIPPHISCGLFSNGELVLFGKEPNKGFRINMNSRATVPFQVQGLNQIEGEIVCFLTDNSNILFFNQFQEIVKIRMGTEDLEAEDYIKYEDFQFGMKLAAIRQEESSIEIMFLTTENEPGLLQISFSETSVDKQSNQCIIEESIEESGIQSRVNSEEKEQSDQQSEISYGSQKEKPKEITTQFQQILANEFLKRKILEVKAKVLESSIKKAEKMVFSLSKFGEEREKRKHIEKVKNIRQKLEAIWNKEIFLRKEIESKPTNIDIATLVHNHTPHELHPFLH